MTPGEYGKLTVMLIISIAFIYGLYRLGKALLATRKLKALLKARDGWAKNRDHGRALELDWNYERDRIVQARRVKRQRNLLRMADVIEAAPLHEKQRLQREAEAMQNEWDGAA